MRQRACTGSQAGPASAQADLYRYTDAGASWQEEPDPCAGEGPAGVEEDLIDLANASGVFFAGLCSPHVGTGSFVVTSIDGGSSWQKAGALPAVQTLSQLAAVSDPQQITSLDVPAWLGCETAEVCRWIGDPHSV